MIILVTRVGSVTSGRLPTTVLFFSVILIFTKIKIKDVDLFLCIRKRRVLAETSTIKSSF